MMLYVKQYTYFALILVLGVQIITPVCAESEDTHPQEQYIGSYERIDGIAYQDADEACKKLSHATLKPVITFFVALNYRYYTSKEMQQLIESIQATMRFLSLRFEKKLLFRPIFLHQSEIAEGTLRTKLPQLVLYEDGVRRLTCHALNEKHVAMFWRDIYSLAYRLGLIEDEV